MNRNVLIIAGGASAASLAIGGAVGYFIASKKLGQQFDERMDVEIERIKEVYEHRISALEERLSDQEDGVDESEEEDDEPSDEEIVVAQTAKTALINYAGMAQKPPLESLAVSNIFDRTKKHRLPPRDDNTGRFVPSKPDTSNDDPSIITQKQFLENEGEYDQVYLRWFPQDKTLLAVHSNDEATDVELVGEANLTLFPTDVPEGEQNVLCIRNTQLETDYEIQLMEESVTDYLGLGEYSED